jgi:hypothetical protein
MRRLALALVLLAAAPTPAAAAHCPRGEIYRVRRDKCVGAQTALARPYVHPPHPLRRPTRLRPPVVRHVADAAPPDPPAAPATVGPDPPPADAELALPELEASAPNIWRICQTAPTMCAPPPLPGR